jgi:predicted nuclease of predicted toxin-antitoxin system
MKRILLDQGMAPGAAEELRREGWTAVHVAEVGMHKAPDAEILAYAARHRYSCVTLDHDFHSHLAFAGANGPTVILLRVVGFGAREQAELIRKIWRRCEREINRGAAVSCDGESIRIRMLPLA